MRVTAGDDVPRYVDITDLGHRYPRGPWLFRGLSRRLVPDEVYALVGPSGSGKSTLLAILSGGVVPAAGTVTAAGVGRICWVFQNPHGVARRTAVDHVALPLLAAGAGRATALESAHGLLDQFGLSDVVQRPFAQLSGGEAQRLMLARGVAARPGLLLVDEPTAQLDVAAAAVVSRSLQRLAGQGVVVVVATHDPATRASCTEVIDLAEFAHGSPS